MIARKIPLIAGLVASLALAGQAFAQEAPAGLSIEKPWARATPPSAKTGAAYMTIRNAGPSDDRLIAASSDAAEAAELHVHLHEGNVMRMRKVDAIPVAAKGSTALAPGALHVMLIGLHAPLKQGGQLGLTLTFEKAGRIAIRVPILGIGALGPDAAQHGHGH